MRWSGTVLVGLLGCGGAAPVPPGDPQLAALATHVGPDVRVVGTVNLAAASAKSFTQHMAVLLPLIGGKPFGDCKLDLTRLTHLRIAIGSPLRIAAELDGDVDRARLACVIGELGLAENELAVSDRPGGITITRDAAPNTSQRAGDELVARCGSEPTCAAMRLGPAAKSLGVRITLAGDVFSMVLDGPGRSRALSDALAAAFTGYVGITARSDDKQIIFTGSKATDEALAARIKAELLEALRVPSTSMMPTLHVGDHVYAGKGPLGRYGVGDVVVHRFEERLYVKRIVAVGGQTVTETAGAISIDGTPIPSEVIERDFAFNEPDPYDKPFTVTATLVREHLGARTYQILRTRDDHSNSWTVPAGQYFLLGDHRDNSNDSRYQGSMPADSIIGPVIGIWFAWKDDAPDWDRIGTGVE